MELDQAYGSMRIAIQSITLGWSVWIDDGSGQAWAQGHAIYWIGGSDPPGAPWSTKNNFQMMWKTSWIPHVFSRSNL